MKKPATFITTLLTMVVVLSLVHVVVANRLSTTGITLSKLEEETKEYRTKNEILSQELFTASSLTMIASKAASLGFTTKMANVYFTAPLPLAIQR